MDPRRSNDFLPLESSKVLRLSDRLLFPRCLGRLCQIRLSEVEVIVVTSYINASDLKVLFSNP
jgi:hypothetical protein